MCLQRHSVRFYTGVNVLGGTSGMNVPPKTGDTNVIVHSCPAQHLYFELLLNS